MILRFIYLCLVLKLKFDLSLFSPGTDMRFDLSLFSPETDMRFDLSLFSPETKV